MKRQSHEAEAYTDANWVGLEVDTRSSLRYCSYV